MVTSPASAQYDSRDPIAEPPQENDILPPADDVDVDSTFDDVTSTSPEYIPRPPPEVFPPSNLRIASWDLSDAPSLMPPPQAAPQASTWRTTFGSERRSEAQISTIPATQAMDVDADIVLLQGVSDVGALRRLFPPRNWRLVVSRRVLSSAQSGAYAGPTQSAALPVRVTAIAVKAKRGLRIIGREHVLDLARAEDAGADGTAPSATVVRIADGTRLLWLLSVALPEACGGNGAECPAHRQIADWQQSKLTGGQTTVIGGRYARRAPGATAQQAQCSHQAIETDLRRSEPAPRSQGAQRQGAGCLALLELPAQ
jgi:hypothetical protein